VVVLVATFFFPDVGVGGLGGVSGDGVPGLVLGVLGFTETAICSGGATGEGVLGTTGGVGAVGGVFLGEGVRAYRGAEPDPDATGVGNAVTASNLEVSGVTGKSPGRVSGVRCSGVDCRTVCVSRSRV
jgi:hypothetical protein